MPPQTLAPATRRPVDHAPVLVIGHDESCLEATRDALAYGRLVNPVVGLDDLVDLASYLGARGSSTLRADPPLPAVVVTELHLETGSAADVLRLLRSTLGLARTPIIVVSDGASAQEVADVSALGATAYLDRGVAADVLVGVLRDADLPWAISPVRTAARRRPRGVRSLREVAR